MIREKHDLTKDEQKAHEATWGGFNDVPAGWHEIDIKTLVQNTSWGRYESPALVEHRQVHVPAVGTEKARVIMATLHFYEDGTGVAVEPDYWGEKVRWYAFGCQHQYVELSQAECRTEGIGHYGRCYHVYKCQTCGHVKAHDSSD